MKEVKFSVKKKPVYIFSPYESDEIQSIIVPQLKNVVKKAFHTADLIIINKLQKLIPSSVKDKTPVLDTSKGIYEFTRIRVCNASCFYIHSCLF